MSVDIEEILGRELHDVAHGLHIPPMPALPQEAPRSHRARHALLVAAVIILVVTVALTIEAIGGGSRELDPAPPVPKPGQTQTRATIPTTPSNATYELNRTLYADGRQVPGAWLWVASSAGAWVAWRDDTTWWWSRDAEPLEIEDVHDRAPVISPNGQYVGAVLGTDIEGDLVGFETRSGGEGFGATPIELGDSTSGNPVRVRAVTDDGRVIAQGRAASVLWLPLVDGGTVDLDRSAPGQEILYNTPAGLVVTDGVDGAPYLAEISDSGELSKLRDLPSDDVVVSPGAARFVWTPPGTLGGEVSLIRALQVQALDGSAELTFNAPAGGDFRVGEWTWEDDDHLVSPVAQDEGPMGERMARCSVEAGRCVLIRSP